MPASMHNTGILGSVFCTCFFNYWQGIHVGTNQDDRTGFCSFEQGNNARPSYASIKFQSELIQFLGDNPGCTDLMKAELRVGMKIAAEGLGIFKQGLSFRNKVSHTILS